MMSSLEKLMSVARERQLIDSFWVKILSKETEKCTNSST
jgi:hypothetical protein